MRYDDVSDPLAKLAFGFFFWFSRFESALKENGYLKSHKVDTKAEACWSAFEKAHQNAYVLGPVGQALIDLAPQRQIVTATGLGFQATKLTPDQSDLAKVAAVLRTVRNNLFHGGKHGPAYWDDPARLERLLTVGLFVLRDFAEQSELTADFEGVY